MVWICWSLLNFHSQRLARFLFGDHHYFSGIRKIFLFFFWQIWLVLVWALALLCRENRYKWHYTAGEVLDCLLSAFGLFPVNACTSHFPLLCKDNLMRKNKRISKRSRFSVKHLHQLSANQLLALYDVTESRYPIWPSQARSLDSEPRSPTHLLRKLFEGQPVTRKGA